MRKLFLPYFFIFLFSGNLLSFPNDNEKILAYFNSAEVQKLDSLCEIIINDSDSDPLDKHYCSGFVHSFLGEYYLNRDNDLSELHLEKAIEHLEAAIIIRPEPELYALLSASYGIMVAHVSIFSKMGTGNKAGFYMQKAMELDSNNVFVNYSNAVGLMKRPALFGGDKERAKIIFNRLLKNLESYEQPRLKWVSEQLIYFRLWQLADLMDEPEEKERLEKILKEEYPDFNLDR